MSSPADLPRFATSACRACSEPVMIAPGPLGLRVILDPATPVYSRESDGEGGGVWLPVVKDVIMAKHMCRGKG